MEVSRSALRRRATALRDESSARARCCDPFGRATRPRTLRRICAGHTSSGGFDKRPYQVRRASNVTAKAAPYFAVGNVTERALAWLDRVPYAVLALPLRLAVATVFWNSAMAKLADWNATLSLFTDEYQVPLLPPE